MSSFRGHNCCSCLAKWLPAYEAELLRRGVVREGIDVFQLTGSASASAGTHAKGGAFDIAQTSTEAIKVARQMGADATWHRTRNQGFMDHAHGVLRGCPHNAPARYQITAVDGGFNGLGRGGRGGRDDGPRPLSKRSWEDGIKWAKARQGVKVDWFETSAYVQNAASKKAGWSSRSKVLAAHILGTDVSFVVVTELYALQRQGFARLLKSKYVEGARNGGRVIFYRRGRWIPAGPAVGATLGRSKKKAVARKFTHATEGKRVNIVAAHLSWELTAGWARKEETRALLAWSAQQFPDNRRLFFGDWNSPALSRGRVDEVGPVMKSAGYTDACMSAPTPVSYRLDRGFGGASVEFTQVKVDSHGASDAVHPGVVFKLRFPK